MRPMICPKKPPLPLAPGVYLYRTRKKGAYVGKAESAQPRAQLLRDERLAEAKDRPLISQRAISIHEVDNEKKGWRRKQPDQQSSRVSTSVVTTRRTLHSAP
jgi:hypothetical protein